MTCGALISAVVLPGTQIGKHVAVAAGAVVRGIVPDNCVVAGVPARVIRRYDADTRTWLRTRARTKPGWVVSTANVTLSR